MVTAAQLVRASGSVRNRSPLAIKKSKSGKYFCTKKCQTIWRNKILYTGENHSNWKDGESAYRRILETS